MKPDNKKRLFEIIKKIDNIHNTTNFIDETKAFGQLRKLNKNLLDKTIKLENKLGKDVLNLIDKIIEKENLNYNSNEEKELVYLIILDLMLNYYLNNIKK